MAIGKRRMDWSGEVFMLFVFKMRFHRGSFKDHAKSALLSTLEGKQR